MGPAGKNSLGIPAFSEKVGKIMKKIHEARQSLPLSAEEATQANGKRKSEEVDKNTSTKESQSETPLPNGIRLEKRAILKNRRLKNEFKQLALSQVPPGEHSNGNINPIFGTAIPPNPTSAMAKRKWAIEEPKGLRHPVVHDDLLASEMMMHPSSFQEESCFYARAMWRTNAEKDPLAPNLNVITECDDSEPLPFSMFWSEDLTKQPAFFNRIRPRAGRSLKRRRRDLKAAAAARRVDSDSPSPPSPGTSPSPRKFVIPDVPYDIPEALSIEVIDAAYYFIHNG